MKSCRNPEAWVNTFTSFMNGFTNLAEDVIIKPEQKTNTTPQENAPSTSNHQETNNTEPNANNPASAPAADLFAPEIELLRGFLNGVKNGFYGEGFAGSSNTSNEQNPPTPASGNKDSRNVNEKSTTTDDCREQVDKNVTSAPNNHPLFNLLEGKTLHKTVEQVNTPNNNMSGNSSQNIPRDSDTDSNGSDCCFIARPTEGEDKDWTMFNMDEAVDNGMYLLFFRIMIN